MLELLDIILGNGSCNNFEVRSTKTCRGFFSVPSEDSILEVQRLVPCFSSVPFYLSLAPEVEMPGRTQPSNSHSSHITASMVADHRKHTNRSLVLSSRTRTSHISLPLETRGRELWKWAKGTLYAPLKFRAEERSLCACRSYGPLW